MSKRPFNKIRRIQKKQNVEEQKEDQNQSAPPKQTSKLPIFGHQKKRINIVSNDNSSKPQQNILETKEKSTLGSKPILFKGKKDGPKLIINSNPTTQITQINQNSLDAPKSTPMVLKKRFNRDFKPRQSQNIVIQQQTQQKIQQQDQAQDSSNSYKHRLFQKGKKTQQKIYNSRVQQFSNQNQQKPNYISPIANIQYRGVSVQPVKASQSKIEQQTKRTKVLKQLLNLENDLYQQTLSIANVTAYEVYINKIKAGFLKNSQDQSFEQKVSVSAQTLPFQLIDFANQAPLDYSRDISNLQQISQQSKFQHFILNLSPVIEQLIQSTSTVSQPPIFLLAFRPTFKKILKCPNYLFLYHSQEQGGLDIIPIGERLYIVQGQIQSLLIFGKYIIGGLKDGNLVVWDGSGNKGSRTSNKIQQLTGSSNFQLPCYFSNHHLQRLSSFITYQAIVSLIQIRFMQFIAIDKKGKISQWRIQDNNGISLNPRSVLQLQIMTKKQLKITGAKRRSQSLYVSSNEGILLIQNKQIKQKLDCKNEQILSFQIPKKSALVYVLSTDKYLRIFNENYSQSILELSLNNLNPRQIIIPEIQHQNRQIIFLYLLYIIDNNGIIYQFNLIQNRVQSNKILNKQAQKDKNVVYHGVNFTQQGLKIIKLMNDLKIGGNIIKTGLNLQKNVTNLKSIIEKNRNLMTILQEQLVLVD